MRMLKKAVSFAKSRKPIKPWKLSEKAKNRMLLAGLAIVFTVGPTAIVYNLGRTFHAMGEPVKNGAKKEETGSAPTKNERMSKETLQAIFEARRALSQRERELGLIESMPAGEEKNAAIKRFLWGLGERCEESEGEGREELRNSLYNLELMVEDIRSAQEEGCKCGK